MNSPSENFDSFFSNVGGRFDYLRLPDQNNIFVYSIKEFESILKYYQNLNPNVPNVNIGFINNPSFNASAGIKNTSHFIGINFGVALLLYNLFNRMMCCPNIFPEIGNSKNEEAKKIFNPQLTDFTQLLLSSTVENLIPKDPIRAMFAAQFLKTALTFLFVHELGHILNGHTKYISANYSQPVYFEVGHQPSKMDPLFIQTLEMDADAYAVNQMMQYLDYMQKTQNQIPPIFRSYYIGWNTSIFNCLFAIYSMFRIFGYKNFKPGDLNTLSHPPSGLRQQMVFGTAFSVAEERIKTGILDQIPDLVVEVIDNVENAFKEISDVEMDREAIRFAFTPEANSHVSFLLSNWDKVKKILSPYSFVGLAANHH